jgi:hypothetical protein
MFEKRVFDIFLDELDAVLEILNRQLRGPGLDQAGEISMALDPGVGDLVK